MKRKFCCAIFLTITPWLAGISLPALADETMCADDQIPARTGVTYCGGVSIEVDSFHAFRFEAKLRDERYCAASDLRIQFLETQGMRCSNGAKDDVCLERWTFHCVSEGL